MKYFIELYVNMIFKINGERNSGTNFLEQLLKNNDLNTYVNEVTDNTMYYWKHGVPDNTYRKRHRRVADIFIFRRLNSWLVSMFYSPYEMFRKGSFDSFLTTPQQILPSNTVDFRTKKIFNEDDNGKTIFEIRYYKYNKIMEYKRQNKNVILVSLEYLQDEKNCEIFLKKLCEKYFLGRENYNFIPRVYSHTKIHKKMKNNSYPINAKDYQDTINLYKNEEIEKHLDKLTFEF
jgi:hypothetical protein